MGGARQVQHRVRRLRQTSPRQAGDGVGELRRRPPRAGLGRAAGHGQSGCAHAACQRRRHAATGWRWCCRRPRRRPRCSSASGSSGAMLLSLSVLYGDEGIATGWATPRRSWSSPTRPTRTGSTPASRPQLLVLDRGGCRRRLDETTSSRTLPPTTPPSSTTPPAPPGWPRASSTPIATCSATRSSSTATRCRTASWFHGMGEWAWAAGIAPLLGPWRLGAVQYVYQREGGFDPAPAARLPRRNQVSNVFTTPTAMRAMMAVEDAGTRYPQSFRSVCSAGEPLNPEAIRWFREQYGVTVLDYYGLTESYPLVRQLPLDGGPRGLDGPADAGLGRADPRRGRAAGGRRASAARSACARAPTRTTRSATGTRPEAPRRRSTASGSTPRTPPSRTRTATSGTRAAPTT